MNAFFILGRDPQLSSAEIAAVYGDRIKRYVLVSPKIMITEMEAFDPTEAAARLGGSVKYGVAEWFPTTEHGEIAQYIANAVVKDVHEKRELKKSKNEEIKSAKIIFSVSGYHNVVAKPIGLETKTILQREGYSVRFAVSREPEMSAAAVMKEGLLEKGTDIVLAVDNGVWIGVTKAVQPFEAQSHRDYDRPSRDLRRGMLPVQLARIMVNLALGARLSTYDLPPKSFSLLDPFCGLGTVLMEAMLLGVPNIIGADIDQTAIHGTRNNLQWLLKSVIPATVPAMPDARRGRREAGIQSSSTGFPIKLGMTDGRHDLRGIELLVRDARQTPPSPQFDAIVTEPFLGEPVRGALSKSDIERRRINLGELYRAALSALAPALKKDGTIVMTLPAYKLGSKFLEFPKEGLIPDLLTTYDLPLTTSPIIYKRSDQSVGREILMLKKKS